MKHTGTGRTAETCTPTCLPCHHSPCKVVSRLEHKQAGEVARPPNTHRVDSVHKKVEQTKHNKQKQAVQSCSELCYKYMCMTAVSHCHWSVLP